MPKAHFKNPVWIAPLALAGAIGALVLAYCLRADGSIWLPVFFMLFGLFGVLVFLEVLTSHMKLGKKHLEIRTNFRKTDIRKSDIIDVTWASGCGVSIQIKDGSWVPLPTFCKNSLGLSNSLRAWLRRG